LNAFVIRTTGDDHEPRQFRTWAPKAVALIGKLPPTLASRAIHIELRWKTVSESVEQLRSDRLDHLERLLRQAVRSVADNAISLDAAEPVIPEALSGRAADSWRPLIAIADLAGGEWPARARRIPPPSSFCRSPVPRPSGIPSRAVGSWVRLARDRSILS
jgi:putative DNA primase/helicase